MQLLDALWCSYNHELKLIERDNICELVWPSPLQRVLSAFLSTLYSTVTCSRSWTAEQHFTNRSLILFFPTEGRETPLPLVPGEQKEEHWRAISQAQLSLMWGTARKLAGEKAWTSTSLIFILSGHAHQFLLLVTTLKLELHSPKGFLLKLEV